MSTCRGCAHSRLVHEHYRPGTDCSRCACASFTRNWLADFRAALVRRPIAVDVPVEAAVGASSKAA